jgi:methionyl-tRNA formyltransferase
MQVAIIGRGEVLYDTAMLLYNSGFEIPLIITSKAAPEYLKTEKDFEYLANKINAKFLYTAKINSTEYIEQIKLCGKIDIAVSINYSGVIASNIINMFPNGILNAHGGDLPKYRGNACQAWAILNGERKIGLCIHKMIGGELDSGPIISKNYMDVTDNTRVGEVYEWIHKVTPKMIFDSINQLNNNSNYYVELQSINPKDALRCYPRKPEDGRINWDKSSLGILRLINASSEPFSGAYCFLDDKICKIWRAELYDDTENYCAINGQVAKLNTDFSIIVITGQGKLLLKEIEYEGIRTNKPAEIVKSIRKRFK